MSNNADTNEREEVLKEALKVLVPDQNGERNQSARAIIESHFAEFDNRMKDITDCQHIKKKLKNIQAKTEKLRSSILAFAAPRPLVKDAMMKKLSKLSEYEHNAEKAKSEYQRLSYENLKWLLNGECAEQLKRIITVTTELQANMAKNTLRKQITEEFIRRALTVFHQYYPSKASSDEKSECLVFTGYLYEYYFGKEPTDTLRTEYMQPAIKQWKQAGIIKKNPRKRAKLLQKIR